MWEESLKDTSITYYIQYTRCVCKSTDKELCHIFGLEALAMHGCQKCAFEVVVYNMKYVNNCTHINTHSARRRKHLSKQWWRKEVRKNIKEKEMR